MDIEIKPSEMMDKNNETDVIRVSKKFIETMGQSIVSVKDKHGLFVNMQLIPEEGICVDDCGFVSSSTIDRFPSIERYIKVPEPITLGCDPETLLIEKASGEVLPMYNFMGKHGDVGNDGTLLEFRPPPSVSPDVVCRNIYGLIKKARNILSTQGVTTRDTSICGISSYKGNPTGFHLHFGLPKKVIHSRGKSVRLARLITNVLDYYVGVPSIIPEGDIDFGRRTAPFVSYGKPGDFRLSSKTLEFRLPGGINMAHPLLAKGLMSIGAVVIEDIMSRINTYTDNLEDIDDLSKKDSLKMFYPSLPDMEEYFKIICNRKIEVAISHMPKIIKDIRMMVGYSKMQNEVESYFGLLFKIKQKAIIHDVEHNWRNYYEQRHQAVVLL